LGGPNQVDVNLFDDAVRKDPYPLYAAIRHAGVVKNEMFQLWMVGRYSDVFTAMRDPGRFSSSAMVDVGRVGEAFARDTMISADPPDHGRLRGVVQRAFTPRAVSALETRITELVDQLLEPLESGEPFEFISALAEPLPGEIIAEMMGVSTADRPVFTEWAAALIAGNSPLSTPAQADGAVAAGQALLDYFADLIEVRQGNPRDDLLTRLIESNQGGTLSHDEVVSSCVLLLFAGLETTTRLIGSSILTLAQHPEQRRQLVEDPTLIPSALEEILRYVGPAQGIIRAVTEDTQLGGVDLQANDRVLILEGSANRDEEAFEHADVFNIHRTPNQHLAFSTGPHVCLGAALARLETRVVLDRILRRAPEYVLATEDPQYNTDFFLRGPVSLEMALNWETRKCVSQ
jgi:cytochrome P450